MLKSKKGLALSSSKGFTLIELLVVIAIIGILATIVLVSLNSARTSARDARRLSDMQQITLAMEMYYDANLSVYPTGAAAAVETALKNANLIGALPRDPSTAAYYLVFNATTANYCFYGALEKVTGQYAVASDRGAGKRSSIPTSVTVCEPNL